MPSFSVGTCGRSKDIISEKLSGNRRYYRDSDVELIIYIKSLLYDDCISIKGVQKIFKNQTINQILRSKDPILKKKNVLSENNNKNQHSYRNKYGLVCCDGPIFNAKDIKTCLL